MNMTINFFIQAILITTALSIDVFITSIGYGFSNIKIPFSSMLLIDALCTLFIGISFLLGNIVEPLLPHNFSHNISISILLFLGILKLFDSLIKSWIKHSKFNTTAPKGILKNIGILFFVYANPNNADVDKSKTLTPKEAIPLAIALSFDGLAVGFGTGIGNIPIFYILFTSIIIEGFSMIIGSYLGHKICKHIPIDFSWVSGFLLILLGILKLLF